MTVEIHQPELEALLQEGLSSGRFETLEDVLIDLLWVRPARATPNSPGFTADQLLNAFSKIPHRLDDLDFSRDQSPDRPLDLF